MTSTGQISGTLRCAVFLALTLVIAIVGTRSAQAQTLKVLYTFTGGADGGNPVAGLIADNEGNLYGSTCCGGAHGAGTVFKLDRAGKQTVLHSFTGGQDGLQPYGTLIRDADGNLYGTTYWGGSNAMCNSGCGVVFKLDKVGKETIIHHFNGRDGAHPYDRLIRDLNGNLYGTTTGGGDLNCSCGVVFVISNAGQEEVLYRFGVSGDGAIPLQGLVQDAEGNFYGTTQWGGVYGIGTVFRLDKARKETVLYNFTGGADGGNPLLGRLHQDPEGNLYGTTVLGGTSSSCGSLCGVVFKLDRSGNETVLYSFNGGTDGAAPFAGLVGDADGNLYGTTIQGGASNYGTVFKLDKAGNETLLHTFTGIGGDGTYPYDDLLRDANGNLYGTAFSGGAGSCLPNGCGIVFMITPAP